MNLLLISVKMHQRRRQKITSPCSLCMESVTANWPHPTSFKGNYCAVNLSSNWLHLLQFGAFTHFKVKIKDTNQHKNCKDNLYEHKSDIIVILQKGIWVGWQGFGRYNSPQGWEDKQQPACPGFVQVGLHWVWQKAVDVHLWHKCSLATGCVQSDHGRHNTVIRHRRYVTTPQIFFTTIMEITYREMKVLD